MSRKYPRERLSALIGEIYNCVLAPEKWPSVLENIRLEFNFCNAVLAVHSPDGKAILAAQAGVEPRWQSIMLNYETEIDDHWGGIECLQNFPLEEPIVQSHAMPSLILENKRYFPKWVRPQGIADAVVIGLESDAVAFANVALDRHKSMGDISETEVEGLRLIAPHLRRAVKISQILELKTIEAATFSHTLENFSVGIALVDQNMMLVHANAAAQTMLAAKNPIRLVEGRVALPLQTSTATLQNTVRQAVGNEPASATIPSRQQNGAPCLVHVLPLRPHMVATAFLHQSPIVALFMTLLRPRRKCLWKRLPYFMVSHRRNCEFSRK